jgi:hypothetical protein
MAWLEDLFSRQQVPILLYNKLNLDELAAIRMATQHRDELVNEKYEEMKQKLNNNVTPGRTLLFLYKELLNCFYGKLYQASLRKTITDKVGATQKIVSTESTIGRLKTVQSGFECLKISGLLKVSGAQSTKVSLTGTGKEVFYLLAKGATPFLCGEFLILSPTQDPAPLAQKLSAIPQKLKFNLQSYYHPMKEGVTYSALVNGNRQAMPFMTNNPKAIERQLFKVSDMAPFASETTFSW